MLIDPDNEALPDSSILFCEDSSGIYIPKRFADEILRSSVSGIFPLDWAILEAGPGTDLYWDAWEMVLDNAIITHPQTGIQYRLYQDGDLWLIPQTACEPNPETDE